MCCELFGWYFEWVEVDYVVIDGFFGVVWLDFVLVVFGNIECDIGC